MSEAKGTTVKAPLPSQEELEARLHRLEYDANNLRWALKKYSVQTVLEDFRNEMMRVEGFLRVTGDQVWDMAGTSDNPHQQFFLSLGNTLTLYADMMQQNLEATDTCYLGEAHRQKFDHLLGAKT